MQHLLASRLINRTSCLACAALALSSAATASVQSLVVNGDFESGSISPWTLDGPSGSLVLGSLGAFSGDTGLFYFEAQTGPNGSMTAALQGIAANASLLLQFDFASIGTAGTLSVGQMAPFIGFLNDLPTISMQPGSSNQLTRYSYAFSAVDGLEGIAFHWNALPGGVIAIDNVSITVVPAPGAVALLGMAGLAGSRRRR